MQSKGYRFGIGAALAAIIAVCLGLGFYGGTVGLPQQHEGAGQKHQTEQRVEAPASNAPLEQVPRGENGNPACKEGEDNRNSDLCAQWKAADAATESAIWTRKASKAVIVGTLIAFLTLVAASFAAWFAQQAARHTQTGAKAAIDQVDLARDTASKELRAYIGVLWAKGYYVGAPLSRVVILIKNYGKTPAFDVVAQTGLYIDTHQTGYPGKRENGSMPIIAHEFGIVEPGQERVIWIDLPDDWIRENVKALQKGEVRLFSQTKINYSDVGGVDRHRGFCAFLPKLRNTGNKFEPGVVMTITASGNVDSWVGQWARVQHLPPRDGD